MSSTPDTSNVANRSITISNDRPARRQPFSFLQRLSSSFNENNRRRKDYNTVPDIDDNDDGYHNNGSYGNSNKQYSKNNDSFIVRSIRNLMQYTHRYPSFVISILLIVLATTISIVWVGYISNHSIYPYDHSNNNNDVDEGVINLTSHHHKETIPTLLSLKDPMTGTYLYALDNALYKHIKVSYFGTKKVRKHHHYKNHTSSMIPSNKQQIICSTTRSIVRTGSSSCDEGNLATYEMVGIVQYPSLILSKNALFTSSSTENDFGKKNDNLVLSWTTGIDENGNDIVKDDDIVLLHCSTSSGSSEKGDLLEAATIGQIKATTANSTLLTLSNNSWYIPQFPKLRYEVCQFSLYQRIGVTVDDDGDDNDDNGLITNESDSETTTTALYRYGLLVTSELLTLNSAQYRPTAIHMAVTNDPTEMVINYITGIAGIPVIQYGISNASSLLLQETAEWQQVTGTSDTYTADQMCQAPANLTEPGKFTSPGYLHTVTLIDLQPNKKYQYRLGISAKTESDDIVWDDDVYEFQSSVLVGCNDEPFVYLVYGDQGCPNGGWDQGKSFISNMTAREILLDNSHGNTTTPGPARALHHIGDLSYAQGAAHHWDAWFTMIESFTTRVPLMVGVGNHEYDHTAGGANGKDPSGVTDDSGFMPDWGNFGDDSGGECGVPTSKRFTMPQKKQSGIVSTDGTPFQQSNGVFWYSYDSGPVHTTVISSEHDLSPGSIQHSWLEQDLKNVNRSLTPWLIVETHRPLYEAEANWASNEVGIGMRNELENLLYDYDVDLVLSGHYHAYYRTCDKLYRSQCRADTDKGPMHITIGTAGAHLDESDLYNSDWTATYIEGVYGYGRVSLMNATTLHFEFVTYVDGFILDDVWINRHR